ncbi:hypothetical protein CJJ13_07965 [Serratia fonticola]|nr:hypothetical protein CJJ13_07965 [Serratia fonticola]
MLGHNPMLAQHLHSIITMQRLAIANGYGWNRFVKMVDQVLPRKSGTFELQLTDPTSSFGFFSYSFAEDFLKGKKQTGAISSRYHQTLKHTYMCLTIASPNSEHFSSLAPSIRRSKS